MLCVGIGNGEPKKLAFGGGNVYVLNRRKSPYLGGIKSTHAAISAFSCSYRARSELLPCCAEIDAIGFVFRVLIALRFGFRLMLALCLGLRSEFLYIRVGE